MKLIDRLKDIVFLTILFTALAIYLDIYGEKTVYNFIFNHVIALAISLIIAKLVSVYIFKLK